MSCRQKTGRRHAAVSLERERERRGTSFDFIVHIYVSSRSPVRALQDNTVYASAERRDCAVSGARVGEGFSGGRQSLDRA